MSNIDEKNLGPRWYVAHTYTGYENKVKLSIEKIVENRGLGHLIYDVQVPVTTEVVVNDKGEKLGEVNLLLKESYEANTIMVVIDKIGSYTMSRAFVATIICFVVLLAAVMTYRYVNRYNSRGRYTRRR
jgi:transcription antitermination factor NusG